MKIRLSSFFVVFTSFVLLFASAFDRPAAAQSSIKLPDSFAISNARIVTGTGADIERGNVIVRDGLIFAVGANLQIPVDLRVIDGSGLTVYPGFFDAASSAGIAGQQRAGAGQPGGGQPFFGQPPAPAPAQSNSAYPAGMQPETAAADLIRTSDSSFETARNNGFTTALVVPRERVVQGQSALVNLAGGSAADAIIKAPVALHVAFQPLQTGQYPTALLGTFSALRQMFLDAQQLQAAQRVYERNPQGIRRPDQNKSLQALFPVLNGEMPVVFQAETEREILRALSFAGEFKLKAIIAGGAEAGKLAAQLKAQNVPVLLSLNFPKRTAAASPEGEPEAMSVLRYRVETPKTAARLAAAGVRFAFQSGGVTNLADFWANANRAVENGLSKPDAIRAMTANAASIFGVADRMGTVEAGKIANLTVTRGDIFDKNRQFTHVFVDGRMFEIRQSSRPAAASSPGAGTTGGGAAPVAGAATAAGNWNMTIEIPGQTVQATLNLQQQGNQLSGTLQSPFGNSQITNGEITAEGFRFVTRVTVGEQIDVVFTGRITGNQMTGTAATPQGMLNFTGTRNPQNETNEDYR